MINSTQFKKMLQILKQEAGDENVRIRIYDYDTSQECDYEAITLHLKEEFYHNEIPNDLVLDKSQVDIDGNTVTIPGNLLNPVKEVYQEFDKDFHIYSQLYYDATQDVYMSALDGNIVSVDGAVTKIQILTDITALSLLNNDYINIKIKLIDSDTGKPLKKQPVYLYISGEEGSIANATTNLQGIASFNIDLSQYNIEESFNVMFVKYNGKPGKYKACSTPITLNVKNVSENDVKTSIDVELDPDGSMKVIYHSSLNGQNLTNAYKEISGMEDVGDVTDGNVFFILNSDIKDVTRLTDQASESNAVTVFEFSEDLYDQWVFINAVFQGNDYFQHNSAGMTYLFARIKPKTSVFEITQPDLSKKIYNLNFNFEVGEDFANKVVLSNNNDELYRTRGTISFYVNNNSEPYYICDRLKQTEISNGFKISPVDDIVIDISDIEEPIGDTIRIDAVYSGNAVISNFKETSYYHYNVKVQVQNKISGNIANGSIIELYEEEGTDPIQSHELTSDYVTFTNIPAGYYRFVVNNTKISRYHIPYSDPEQEMIIIKV